MVFFFADFALKPRIVPDFAVYAMFYLKKYFTLRLLENIFFYHHFHKVTD